MTLKKLLQKVKNIKENQEFEIKGWLVSNRGNEKIRFLTINDGSTVSNLQVVAKGEIIQNKNLSQLSLGTSIIAKGLIHLTPQAQQPLELALDSITILNGVDEDFPIQKKETSL